MRNPFLAILIQPFQTLPLPPPNSFLNKTAIITGANTGIGYATAEHLIRLGIKTLILTARDLSKGEQAKAKLISTFTSENSNISPAAAGFSPDELASRIQVWHLDLASFDNVKAFIIRVNQELENLDYLYLNAGVGTWKYKRTENEWETMLQVNGLSTALMGLLLLPKLIAQSRRSSSGTYDPPRVVITASGLHAIAPFDESRQQAQDTASSTPILDKLNSSANWEENTKKYDEQLQYSTTKLLNVYTAQRIAKIVPNDDQGRPLVIVNTLCPGFCKSDLQREGLPFPFGLVRTIFGRTTEVGSRNLVAAVKLLGMESHGEFIMDCKVTK